MKLGAKAGVLVTTAFVLGIAECVVFAGAALTHPEAWGRVVGLAGALQGAWIIGVGHGEAKERKERPPTARDKLSTTARRAGNPGSPLEPWRFTKLVFTNLLLVISLTAWLSSNWAMGIGFAMLLISLILSLIAARLTQQLAMETINMEIQGSGYR